MMHAMLTSIPSHERSDSKNTQIKVENQVSVNSMIHPTTLGLQNNLPVLRETTNKLPILPIQLKNTQLSVDGPSTSVSMSQSAAIQQSVQNLVDNNVSAVGVNGSLNANQVTSVNVNGINVNSNGQIGVGHAVIQKQQSQVQSEKEKQKKEKHNAIERKRRDRINEYSNLLGLTCPTNEVYDKWTKGSKLENAYEHVIQLQRALKEQWLSSDKLIKIIDTINKDSNTRLAFDSRELDRTTSNESEILDRNHQLLMTIERHKEKYGEKAENILHNFRRKASGLAAVQGSSASISSLEGNVGGVGNIESSSSIHPLMMSLPQTHQSLEQQQQALINSTVSTNNRTHVASHLANELNNLHGVRRTISNSINQRDSVHSIRGSTTSQISVSSISGLTGTPKNYRNSYPYSTASTGSTVFDQNVAINSPEHNVNLSTTSNYNNLNFMQDHLAATQRRVATDTLREKTVSLGSSVPKTTTQQQSLSQIQVQQQHAMIQSTANLSNNSSKKARYDAEQIEQGTSPNKPINVQQTLLLQNRSHQSKSESNDDTVYGGRSQVSVGSICTPKANVSPVDRGNVNEGNARSRSIAVDNSEDDNRIKHNGLEVIE